MAFRNPEILYGLFALAIPVIIHLFNFRRYTTIYFSSIRQLASIQKDTKSKSKLKNLLILLSRMLLFAALVLAFANPYLPLSTNNQSDKQSVIGIYIDNSFSQDALNEQGTLFNQTVNQVIKLANELPSGQRLVLLTNDREPKMQRVISVDQLIRYVYEIKLSGAVSDLGLTITQFNGIVSELPENERLSRRLWVFSDFQTQFYEHQFDTQDTSLQISLFPIQPNQFSNISIDSCWFENMGHLPNEPEKLMVKLSNYSENPVKDIPVKLFMDDSLKAVGTASLDESSTATVEISYQHDAPGIVHARIQIDDYPVAFDNELYFSYMNNKKIRVLEISDSQESVWKALLSSETSFDYTLMSSKTINYAAFEQFQLIILSGLKSVSSGLRAQLLEFSGRGGNLVLVPGENSMADEYASLQEALSLPRYKLLEKSRTVVSPQSMQHPLLKGAIASTQDNPRLPYFNSFYSIEGGSLRADPVLLDAAGRHLAFVAHSEKSHYLIFTASLSPENTDLPNHPLFVPLIYNFAFQSTGTGMLYQQIGSQQDIELPIVNSGEGNYSVVSRNDRQSFIPEVISYPGEVRIKLAEYLKKAGNYDILFNQSAVAGSAWNYNRNESAMRFLSFDELEEKVEAGASDKIKIFSYSGDTFLDNPAISRNGVPLWQYFLYLAVLFLIVEMILVNRK